MDLQNQLNDAMKRNEKFHEQLIQTEQQVEANWMDRIKEKDKRFNTSYIIIMYTVQYIRCVHIIMHIVIFVHTYALGLSNYLI